VRGSVQDSAQDSEGDFVASASSLISVMRRFGMVAMAMGALALGACSASGPRQPTTQAPELAPPPPVAALPPPSGTIPSPDGKVRIGLLVPLSGDNRDIGQGMLDAAQMALFDLGKKDIVLLPIDSGGTPEQAIDAAHNVLSQGAQLILGPLFSTSTQAMAPVAREAGVNVITFSNDPAVAQPGVFVMGFTVGPQVQRVTGYAIAQGLRQLAVIAPSSSYGQSVVNVMQDTAAQQGATVQAGFFDPQATDVNAAVTGFAQSARGAQAVMIPVGGARLSSVAPLLAYRDLDPRQVKYLGTGLWDVPGIWREGALLGAWYAAPPPELRADFEKRFNDTYGHRPPRLATLAYDAVALAGALSGPNGPDFSATAIANPNGFAGLDGIFRFTPDGQPQRGLAVLEVTRDGVKTVSPAPTSFQQLTN
jgi:ABC-type branched-subunit amino acid transport system substrate-binding protein